MDSTATFYVTKTLPIAHEAYLSIYLKTARALRLRGQIIAQGGYRYHFRIDGPAPALKEFVAFAAVGGPALGLVKGLYLWIGDELYTEEEAIAQTRQHIRPADNPAKDHVVPESYV